MTATAAVSQRSYRVLIVDDNRNIHEDFTKVLIRPAGPEISDLEAEIFGEAPAAPAPFAEFKIDSAYQGEEGVEKIARAKAEGNPYALAFVDMRMPPGIDGLVTICRLWEIDPEVQVVICSAYSDYSWSEIIAKIGHNDRMVILRKPFDNIEVLQLAHALTEKWALQQRVRRHVDQLENLVSARTAELRESQAIFRQILENATDLISIVDEQHAAIYSSPSHMAILGHPIEDVAQMPAFVTVHPDDLAAVQQAFDHTADTGQPELVVFRKRHKDGSWRFLEGVFGVVDPMRGRRSHRVVVARDITERQQKEVQIRLAQKLESIGLLAAGIAHEINTPMQFIGDNARFLADAFGQLRNVIRAYGSVVQAAGAANLLPELVAAARSAETAHELPYLQSEIPRTLEQSLEGITRVAKIVRSLKEFSHPGSPTRTPIDINHAIENAAIVCRHEWKYVADVVTDFDHGLPLVPCLPDEFNQAVLNLVINAAHAIAEARPPGASAKGMITIKTVEQAGWAVISVVDTGTGIPEAIRDRIFEPFFTTKPAGKGTGQGLSIVRAVAVKHGGTVEFTSQLGKGTTFVMKVPLHGSSDGTTAPFTPGAPTAGRDAGQAVKASA